MAHTSVSNSETICMKVSKFGVIPRKTLHRTLTGVNIGHLKINSCSFSKVIQDNTNRRVLIYQLYTAMALFELNITSLSSQNLQTLNTQSKIVCDGPVSIFDKNKGNCCLAKQIKFCFEYLLCTLLGTKFLQCNKSTAVRIKR